MNKRAVDNLSDGVRIALAIFLTCVSVALSYWAAILNHPSALWIWRDLLGVL